MLLLINIASIIHNFFYKNFIGEINKQNITQLIPKQNLCKKFRTCNNFLEIS